MSYSDIKGGLDLVIVGLDLTKPYYKGDVAAEVIYQSDLTDEELVELWDSVTSAKFSPSVDRPEYRVEFIDKVKFFALLLELQAKLGLAIDMFYGKLGREKARSVASSNSTLLVVKRNNPFMNDVNITMPVTQA